MWVYSERNQSASSRLSVQVDSQVPPGRKICGYVITTSSAVGAAVTISP